MAQGQVFKRCGCRNPATGKQYGKHCPKLGRRGHGSYWYRYDAPAGPDSRRRRPAVGPFRTKEDAEADLTGTLSRVRRAPAVDVDRSLTFGAYLDDWLVSKRGLKASIRAAAVEHITLYFKPGLGHLRLADLRDSDFEQLYTATRQLGRPTSDRSELGRRLLAARRRHPRPLSPQRIARVHATARSALNTAVKRRKIPYNPIQYVELDHIAAVKPLVWLPERVAYWRRTGRRPGPVMVWTPKQANAFLDFVADDDLYALWRLIAYRGLRRGEAIGLPDHDVHLDNAVLDVRETLVRAADTLDGPADPDDPKSEAGARTVGLDAGTVDALRGYRRRQAERRLALGPAWVDSGRFFTQPDGAALNPAWVTQRFGYLADRAGRLRTRCTATTTDGEQCRRHIVGGRCHQHGGSPEGTDQARRDGLPPVRLHDLRHGAATYALKAGIPTKVVSDDLGHARTQTTENHYTSVLPELKQASADAVADTIHGTTSA
jgi:integrase